MKLALIDMDGTLFDTRYVNFYAYNEALKEFNTSIDEEYFCNECNGKHYKTFLPQYLNSDEDIEKVHHLKKEAYFKFLDKARINTHLFSIIEGLKKENYKIALCTTASKKNTYDILDYFNKREIFDLILTQEEIKNKKPNPEVFLKAMEYYNAKPEDTLIFEDAEVGIIAARETKASVFVVNKF